MLIPKSRRKQDHYFRVGYKYGIKVSNIFYHALCLDEEAENNLWKMVIYKYISKVKYSLKFMKYV